MAEPQPAASPDPLAAGRFDEALLLVGRLNYSWTNTESLLIHLIAGLAGTGKDAAVIIFLTLNTTRARLDLVERLAKMPGRADDERKAILVITGRLARLAGMRNRYNHCIYAFDPEGGPVRTIQMRIAARRDEIRVGRSTLLDAAALEEILRAIEALEALNRDIWATVLARGYPF